MLSGTLVSTPRTEGLHTLQRRGERGARELTTHRMTLAAGGSGSFVIADEETVVVLLEGRGALEAGRQSFTWDASQHTTAGELSFNVVATSGSTAVTSTALERNKVVSVSNDNNVLNLQLQNGASVAYSAVKAIL